MKFIFRNKYIFKLLVILALFYKNIFFYNSLCCNCCKENILDVKKNSKEKKPKTEKIKPKEKKPKTEKIKPKEKKPKTEKIKPKEEKIKTEKEKTNGEKIKTEKIKPKVGEEELEVVDVYIYVVWVKRKFSCQFSKNIKGSDLQKKIAKILNEKNIEIRLHSKLCEDNTIYTLEQGGTLYVYKKNEKK